MYDVSVLQHVAAVFFKLLFFFSGEATLKEKEKELESAHQEIDKAKEHLEQKRAALKKARIDPDAASRRFVGFLAKEQERTQQLESQVAEADAKVEVLGKEERFLSA